MALNDSPAIWLKRWPVRIFMHREINNNTFYMILIVKSELINMSHICGAKKQSESRQESNPCLCKHQAGALSAKLLRLMESKAIFISSIFAFHYQAWNSPSLFTYDFYQFKISACTPSYVKVCNFCVLTIFWLHLIFCYSQTHLFFVVSVVKIRPVIVYNTTNILDIF